MAIKNKYQRQKRQYSNDGGQTWFDVVPANYRRGNLIEEASEDCNTIEWVVVPNAWYCIEDTVSILYRWVDIEQTMCNGYNKYSMEKQQLSTDSGKTWIDTGNTRQGNLIEANSKDCGYKPLYQWVIVQNEYICNGYDKYVKEKQQQSTDNGVTWTDTGNIRQGNILQLNSKDCGYVPSYSEQYLTVEALETDNVTINIYPQYTNSKVYYKKDNEEWTEYNESDTITLNSKSKIMFKQTLPSSSQAAQFEITTGYVNVYGNIMSMVYGDDFFGKTSLLNYNLGQMFNACNIKDAKNLILPATTLGNECYNSMFYECRSLTQAPSLPATTLTNSCYANMFYGCVSLTQAPVLPATTLAEYCYDGMFQGCTSLTNAPILYATVPVTGCYNGMFRDCTSLDTINCQLSYLIDTATTGWVTNVQTNSGNFTYNCLNEEWTTGDNGIPTNWSSQCE